MAVDFFTTSFRIDQLFGRLDGISNDSNILVGWRILACLVALKTAFSDADRHFPALRKMLYSHPCQFIDGVKPLWEDEACKDGGRWAIKLPKTHTAKYWEELLLGMIGEQFDLVPTGEILGLVLSLKFSND